MASLHAAVEVGSTGVRQLNDNFDWWRRAATDGKPGTQELALMGMEEALAMLSDWIHRIRSAKLEP